MKTCFVSILFFCIAFKTHSQRYWIGAASTAWDNTANWSTSSGGAGGASIPGMSDLVNFTLASPPNNCILTIPVTISQFTMSAGTLTLAAPGSLTVTSVTNKTGGVLNVGDGTLSFPSFTDLSGGTVNGGSGTINFGNGLSISASSFVPGTGTVIFNGGSDQTVNLTTTGVALQFYNLVINKANNSLAQFNTTDSVQVNNMVTFTAGRVGGNAFLKVQKDLWSQVGFGGSALSIACTGPGTSTITLDLPLAVTGVAPFVGIMKSNPTDVVNVITTNAPPNDTIRIGNFNADFFIRSGVFQFPNNPPVKSSFRSITIEPAGTLIAPQNYLFNGGRHVNTGGTFNANGGTYVFYDQTVPAETNFTSNVEIFNNLIVDIAGGQFSPGLTDTLVVNGTLTLRRGLITGQSNSALNVKGNMAFESTMDNTQTNTKLAFTGTADQTISFAPAVIDRWNASVTLNKDNGNLILNSPWTLDEFNQVFTFIRGVLLIPDTANNYIYFTNNYSVSGASNISYVDGPVRVKRWTNDPFEFPIGNAGFYGPIRISDFWASGEDIIFSGQYSHQVSQFATQGTKEPPIVNISTREWWQIKRVSGPITSPPYLWLSFDNLRSGGVTDPSKLRVSRWDAVSSVWQDRGNGGINVNFVRSTSPVSEYSPFTLGSTDATANPLPVHLISFSATAKTQYNLLQWKVTDEMNFDKYIVESSSDGSVFNTIGSVKSRGATGEINYSFNDTTLASKTFYRLKMLDIDGRFEYSKIVIVNRSGKGFAATVLPNPGGKKFTISIFAESISQATIRVNDISGKTIYQKGFTMQKGINNYTYDIPQLTSGIYFITVINDRGEQEALQYVVKP